MLPASLVFSRLPCLHLLFVIGCWFHVDLGFVDVEAISEFSSLDKDNHKIRKQRTIETRLIINS
jgi:hypothetical protein